MTGSDHSDFHGVCSEVARVLTKGPNVSADGPQATMVEPVEPKVDGRKRGLGLDNQLVSSGRQRRQCCSAVRGVRHPLDQPVALEPVDGVGDAGRVHLKALAHLAQRQRSRAGERQQCQSFEPAEVQPQRPKNRVDPAKNDLVSPRDRRGCNHGIARHPTMVIPVAPRFRDGVEVQSHGVYHMGEILGRPSISRFEYGAIKDRRRIRVPKLPPRAAVRTRRPPDTGVLVDARQPADK